MDASLESNFDLEVEVKTELEGIGLAAVTTPLRLLLLHHLLLLLLLHHLLLLSLLHHLLVVLRLEGLHGAGAAAVPSAGAWCGGSLGHLVRVIGGVGLLGCRLRLLLLGAGRHGVLCDVVDGVNCNTGSYRTKRSNSFNGLDSRFYEVGI